MSTRTFARRFREETGLSPGRWLTQQRLRRARHLLESSDLPVERVAHEVGFATATSLRRHLAAEAGVAPSAHRRTGAPSVPPTRAFTTHMTTHDDHRARGRWT